MRKHLVFLSFLLLVLTVAVYVIEFITLPKARQLARDAYLMGWIGYPNNPIDDTRLNNLGLTGDEPEFKSREGVIRILTLGGSTLFNRRFTERLIAVLDDKSDLPIEVVGAAYRGHTTRSSVIKYDYLTDRFEFDYVVVYHAMNDTWANNVDPDDYTEDYTHLDAWYHRNWLLDNSIMARDLYNRYLYRKPERVDGAAAFKSVETFASNLEEIVTRTIRDGAVPLLVTYCTCVPPDYSLGRFLKGEVSYNNPDRYDAQAIEGWGPKDAVLEGVALHNQVTAELARQYDLPLLDAAVIFGSDPIDFGDVAHFSDSGTDRFAALLADFILEQCSDQVGDAE